MRDVRVRPRDGEGTSQVRGGSDAGHLVSRSRKRGPRMDGRPRSFGRPWTSGGRVPGPAPRPPGNAPASARSPQPPGRAGRGSTSPVPRLPVVRHCSATALRSTTRDRNRRSGAEVPPSTTTQMVLLAWIHVDSSWPHQPVDASPDVTEGRSSGRHPCSVAQRAAVPAGSGGSSFCWSGPLLTGPTYWRTRVTGFGTSHLRAPASGSTTTRVPREPQTDPCFTVRADRADQAAPPQFPVSPSP